MRKRIGRLPALIAILVSLALITPPAEAHNPIVHQEIVDYAYEAMLYARSLNQLRNILLLSPPDRTHPREWQQFVTALTTAPDKWRNLPSQLDHLELSKLQSPPVRPLGNGVTPAGPGSAAMVNCNDIIYDNTKQIPDDWWKANMGDVHYPVSNDFGDVSDCGAIPRWTPGGIFDAINSEQSVGSKNVDHTGLILGYWSASVDNRFDDTHVWNRLTNAGGLGNVQNLLNDAVNDGLEGLLVPIVCLADCIFGGCSECRKHAKHIAQDANPIDDIEGLLPGVNDQSGSDYTGMWHHMNMNPGASNDYDDHEGELFEEAGPNMVPAAEDLILMAYFDVTGLSIHYDKSEGVKNYQIQNADDGSQNTQMRDKGEWQFASIAHTPMEPVDNLAYHSWRIFRDGLPSEGIAPHNVRYMSGPLHALGDATVPMHVAATSSWGHRPFEDAQMQLFSQIRKRSASDADQRAMMAQVLYGAFQWWLFIEDWRKRTGHNTDVPVREMVTQLAQQSYDYSMQEYSATGKTWPFLPGATALWFVKATREDSIALYTARPDASDLGRPPIQNGISATLALLVAAADELPSPPANPVPPH